MKVSAHIFRRISNSCSTNQIQGFTSAFKHKLKIPTDELGQGNHIIHHFRTYAWHPSIKGAAEVTPRLEI